MSLSFPELRSFNQRQGSKSLASLEQQVWELLWTSSFRRNKKILKHSTTINGYKYMAAFAPAPYAGASQGSRSVVLVKRLTLKIKKNKTK